MNWRRGAAGLVAAATCTVLADMLTGHEFTNEGGGAAGSEGGLAVCFAVSPSLTR